jgi:fibronectin type 3 domain-containing protein
MKKKLLATLFMVCFMFIFAPKTVHAYSYYWYVNPTDTLYSDIAENRNFYLAGKESKYAYYCYNMEENTFHDGANPTRGMLYDEFKIISKGMGSIVLRMDERMSERNRNNIKEYGLKFQKRKGTDKHYYIYIIKQDVKYYLNIDRNVNKLGFYKNSKTEWIVNPETRSNYLFRIVDNKTGDLFLNVDANGLQVTTNSQPLYLYHAEDLVENTYTIHDKEVEYKHSDKLPQPKYKEYKTFYSYTKKPLAQLQKQWGYVYRQILDMIPDEDYTSYKVGENPGFDYDPPNEKKEVYANYYNKANIKLKWNIKPTDKDIITYNQRDYNGATKQITGQDIEFDVPEGGWISLEFPSVYDSGKYYKVTSVKENGTELKVTRMDGVEKENERGPFPDSYYFDTVNKDATYEITIEASYPEVKDFYYNLYVKRGDFDSYSNEGMITNLTDSKVQLLTTTKELDGGVLRDPFIILPFGYRDYEKQHSISYKYEYYRVKDGKDTRLDLTGNSVSVDLKDIFANIKDEKQVKVYAVVTKTRKEDGAFKTFKTEDVTITCKYEGGDFGIDIANADTIHQIQSNRIVVLMKKTNENNEAASCEIKREGDEDYTKIEKAGNGFPYVITQNGTYTIRLTDKFGKSATTTLEYKNIKKDMTAPEISGVEDGKTYCLTRTITVIDEHLRDVKVNGKRIELDENNQYVLSGRGKQVITATDDYDNVTEITVTINDHHTGGKATCKAKAICDICKMEYGMQISIEKPSITAKSTNGTTIIRWKKVINASGYKVYRAKKKKGKYELLNTTEALSYSDSSIIGGRNYYYKVATYYKNESTTINGEASDVVLQVGTLKKVSLRVKNKKKSTASLSWKKVAGAKKYQIYRATRKKGKYSKIATTKKLTYKNTLLSKKKTYYYKVRAYYVKAGKNIYGSYSNAKSIKITK